jgi:sterol desaturase/sphingolipid hydroxylase (fatty acid hydroxylase superfamily)
MLAFLAEAYSTVYGLVNSMVLRLAFPAQVCLVYFLLETILPRGSGRNSLGSYGRGAVFVAASVAINTFVLEAATWLIDVDHVKPLAVLDLSPLTESEFLPVRVLGWFVAAFAIMMIGNFFYYWLHRAQHRFAWMWRFHRVHHSITEMSATNGYHHIAEDLFQFTAVTVPMAFLLGVATGPVPWIVLTIASTHAYFIHSSANINIGPFRYILGDNRYHRIHHSLEERHFDRNFATLTPLWDLMFGTAHFPRADEWPKVGLSDTSEPKTMRDYLLMPFRP